MNPEEIDEIENKIMLQKSTEELNKKYSFFKEKLTSYMLKYNLVLWIYHNFNSSQHNQFVKDLLIKEGYQPILDRRQEFIGVAISFHSVMGNYSTSNIAIVLCKRKKKRFWQRKWYYVPVYFVNYYHQSVNHLSEGFIYHPSSKISAFMSLGKNKPIPMMINALSKINPQVIVSVA